MSAALGEQCMGSLWQDPETPGLTAVLAITLALGIGASTTSFRS